MKKLLLILLMTLSAAVVNAQTSIQVQTHNVVALDEQFNVTFIIEGSKPSDFEWQPGEGFTLIWGPQQGRSTSVQIVNGKRTESSQTTYSYILRPTQAGKFIIPKARATVKGKEIFSAEQTVEVVSQGTSSASAAASGSAQAASQQRSKIGRAHV